MHLVEMNLVERDDKFFTGENLLVPINQLLVGCEARKA